jgi:hypothetical protein
LMSYTRMTLGLDLEASSTNLVPDIVGLMLQLHLVCIMAFNR